jgi:raffinose/stachyose/melibiose transport system permease protein
LVILINSFKTARNSIFREPLALPDAESFSMIGYQTVMKQGDFFLYFQNSMIVTVASLFFILLVRGDGRLCAQRIPVPRQHADGPLPGARHHDPDPDRTVAILEMMVKRAGQHALGADTCLHRARFTACRLHPDGVHASGLGRPEKCGLGSMGLANTRSSSGWCCRWCGRPMATVAVFNMIPIWNDLWFPLILAPAEETKTLTLGSQVFIGQFVTDWNAVLSALSMAILPVLVLYVIFSRQLIRGITSGAVK